MSQVTAILPTYGRHELTLEAIAGLRCQSAPPAEIVVVDDGSAEPFAPVAGVQVLRHPSNLGFAAAVNTGVKAAKTPLISVINNDVSLNFEWFERVSASLFDHKVDFVCGKLYRPDGLIDGTFDLISRGGLAWRAGAGRADSELWSKPQPIAFASFTAILARTEAVSLDESYHSYYEDVEWSLRAAIHNKTGYFDPSATGVHLGSATSGAWSPYWLRQMLRNHRRLALQYLLPAHRRPYRVARGLLRAHFLRGGHWPRIPREAVAAKERGARLGEILQTSENRIRELQEASGMDRLWRWYFRLAGEGE